MTHPDLDTLDQDTFGRIRALGDDLLVAMVADLRRRAPDDIAGLTRALAEGDGVTASRAAHGMKGLCLVLGATRMGALAADIESAAADGNLDRAASLVPALELSLADLLAALEASISAS